MNKRVRLYGSVILAAAFAVTSACIGTPGKTETYIFPDSDPLDVPIDAWLRTVEVVSNNFPLTTEYPLVNDSLIAIASKYEVRLSTIHGSQPYVADFVVHERSYTVDLSTLNSVMAVLNLSPSADGSACVARIVYSEASANSVVALYYLNNIGESIFASLIKTIKDHLKKSKPPSAAP